MKPSITIQTPSSIKKLAQDGSIWCAEKLDVGNLPINRLATAYPNTSRLELGSYTTSLENGTSSVTIRNIEENFSIKEGCSAAENYRVAENKVTENCEQDSPLPTGFLETALPLLQAGTLHQLSFEKDPIHKLASSPIVTPHSILLQLIQDYLERQTSVGAVVWIGEEVRPLPHMLSYVSNGRYQSATSDLLQRSIFIDSNDSMERGWIMQHALSSRGVAVVVSAFCNLNSADTRRFVLAAQKEGTLGFIITPHEKRSTRLCVHSDWVVSNQATGLQDIGASYKTTPTASFKVHLRRMKGPLQRTRTWHVRCKYDRQLSIDTLSPVVHRSVPKALQKSA